MHANATGLQALMDRLSLHCTETGLTIFRGYIDPEEHDVVTWDEEAGDLWAFLETASSLGARMLYVHAFRFTEGDLDEALEGDDEGDEEQQSGDRRERLKAYGSRVGALIMMTVMYRFDGVFHAWSMTEPWYDEFLSLRDAQEFEDEDAQGEDYRAHQRKEQALIQELATALANDPRFPECRNQESRLALLRRLKPEIHEIAPSDYGQRAVVREAQAIFDLDVRPKLRENPRERVLALQSQGFSLAQIAARMSLKASEVQRLLNEKSSES